MKRNFANLLIIPLFLAFVISIVGLGFFLSYAKEPPKKFSSIQEITSETEKTQLITFVEFYSDFCKYCKDLAPKLEQLDREYGDNVAIIKINGEFPENENIKREFRVQWYPSLYVINPYRKTIRMIGTDSLQSYELLKNEYLKEIH